MCIFTQRVASVASTKIFARLDGARQLLGYEMEFAAAGDLAMVLPTPVVGGSPDGAVEFLDLSGYPTLFADLDKIFEGWISGSALLAVPRPAARPLPVHQVGGFDASFVPCIGDFARLEVRFRLPLKVWDSLQQYRDYGFAVFKLRGEHEGVLARLGLTREAPRAQRAHPMAFSLPTRWHDRLFFPTLHVHDGQVHREARFDHALFCQSAATPREWRGGFVPAPLPISDCVVVEKSRGLVDPDLPCHRMRIIGLVANDDIIADCSPRE